MKSSFKFGFLFFIFFIIAGKIGAVEVIQVDEKTKKVNLSLNSELFIDQQNHFSYEGVNNSSFDDNFKPTKLESVSMGYINSTIWMRFIIANESEKNFVGAIEMPIPWSENIDVYIQSADGLSVTNFGSTLPFTDRKIDARSFFLPITINPQEFISVYIKTKGSNTITLAPWLYSEKEAAERLTYIAMFNGALIGIILIMILYNLSNYISLRDKNYAFYILYLASLLFLMGTYYGYNFQIFWEESPQFNTTVSPLTVVFTFFAALLYSRSFLDVGKNFVKSDKYLILLICLSAAVGLLSLIVDSKSLQAYALAFIGSLTFFFLIYLSALSVKKKISGSLYLLLAWLSLSLGELVSFMMMIGFIGYNSYLYDFFALSVVLNILMISFAMVERIKDDEMRCEIKVKKEHEVAERLNMSKKELRELNDKLQRKVTRQEHELLSKDKEHEKYSIKDDVTGLYKKVKLEDILTNELHRTKRYDYKFSLILINIDGLKDINDTHGFEVGNSLMKEMADLFMRHIRYLDTVGRWSETEYLVVCPETDAESALVAAHHLQALVEKNKFFFVGRATASFGVTQVQADDTLQDIMKKAYEALSLAKDNGKNRAEMI
ncbi:diguanylate cyclase [Sulfurimonas sp.]|uniref:sensor domain-containing diguanylate cyclase n=1 Tax=Sulfurimonas sp. TaxID=2022749 RepID=UPI0025D4DAAF|nr:diguanylate cyclase [Sulfurimonas sp.]MBW6488836.1 sensor domain-containing diguanylate cyclase [Sulfurimonas sp.]